MKFAHVIGQVTLSQCDPAFRGGSFLLVSPCSRAQISGAGMVPLSGLPTPVVYDQLGAGNGDLIGVVEGAEAAAPFTTPTPVDAYNAALIDRVHYQPPAPDATA